MRAGTWCAPTWEYVRGGVPERGRLGAGAGRVASRGGVVRAGAGCVVPRRGVVCADVGRARMWGVRGA